jgi:serralysin
VNARTLRQARKFLLSNVVRTIGRLLIGDPVSRIKLEQPRVRMSGGGAGLLLPKIRRSVEAHYCGAGALAAALETDMSIDFTRLFFFGDSITDAGRLPEPFRPDPPYVDGRFTNGLVYAQVLTQELGVPSTNFAYGGAKALPSGPEQFLIGLDAQVTEFEITHPFGAPSGSAGAIFIGGNDLHDADPDDPTIVARVLESIDDAAVRLARNGVDELILFNLPATSLTPRGLALPADERAAEDALIAAYNAGLLTLEAAYDNAGVPTTIVAGDRLTREVHADPETFGLKVLDLPLYSLDENDKPVETEITRQFAPDEVAFFDPVHPTAASHRILADFAEATLRADQVIFGNEESGAVVSGVSGADFVVAGGGDDSVLAADGNDVVLAGLGNDMVDGGAGSDRVIGGSGNDVLKGSAGSDLLAGNAGDDIIDGGLDVDTAMFKFSLLSLAGVSYAESRLVIEGPEGRDGLTGIENLQFQDRVISQVDDNSLVDDVFYLFNNPDVFAAGVEPETHFAEFGWREGRDPNAFFDTQGYLTANPDVAAAGINPLVHYDQFGWREGRDPSALFDTQGYLAASPDVAAAGINPLTHFLQYGIFEGRQPLGDTPIM